MNDFLNAIENHIMAVTVLSIATICIIDAIKNK